MEETYYGALTVYVSLDSVLGTLDGTSELCFSRYEWLSFLRTCTN
jgi:hypothetical protein